jgi:hypothetical protein
MQAVFWIGMVRTEKGWVRKGRKGGETRIGRGRVERKVEIELSMWVFRQICPKYVIQICSGN